jgi:hypothetical protein
LVTPGERKETPLKDEHWRETHKKLAGGEGPEAFGGEVFSVRQHMADVQASTKNRSIFNARITRHNTIYRLSREAHNK